MRTPTEKLSRLQKQILVLALRNKLQEGREFDAPMGADVYHSQILAEIYEFPTRWPLRHDERWKERAGHRRLHLDFDPAEIGQARYDAACSSISRAMARLEARGLVKLYHGEITKWAGCQLTPLGVETAKRLS